MGEPLMRWHLVDPAHRIVRSVEASCLPEARFRLAPIPDRHFVVSAADYATGYNRNAAPTPIPTRLGRGEWYAAATTDEEREAIHLKLQRASVAGFMRWQMENPEKEQARRAKIAAYQRQVAANRRKEARRRANIRRGIENARKRRADAV